MRFYIRECANLFGKGDPIPLYTIVLTFFAGKSVEVPLLADGDLRKLESILLSE